MEELTQCPFCGKRFKLSSKRLSKLSLVIAEYAVRDSYLEDLHCGKKLPQEYIKGDYSLITESEMRRLMLDITKNIEVVLRALLLDKKIHIDIEPEIMQLLPFGATWDRSDYKK